MKVVSKLHDNKAQLPAIQVAVGVIKNGLGEILISLRDQKLHQGGLWEFPGGKIESAETPEQALIRELKEELDICVTTATPLININYSYPDLCVRLHVFLVENYQGEALSLEGQPFKWVAVDDLASYAFPAANQAIVKAARLPPYYAIVDDAEPDLLLPRLHLVLDSGIKLIQARLKTLPVEDVEKFLAVASPLCRSRNTLLLLNSTYENKSLLPVDGIHLTSRQLLALNKRPENQSWVAASCHNRAELLHAQNIGVDFVVLAPVLPTATHPEAGCLGWGQFSELVAQVNLPVFALGGLSQADLATARLSGAQGIAGIRAFL